MMEKEGIGLDFVGKSNKAQRINLCALDDDRKSTRWRTRGGCQLDKL